MATRIECYVDTSAFIAFLDRSDSYHPLFFRLFSNAPNLVTSALVVSEGHGWFLRRYDQRRAMLFLNFVQELADLDICPFDQQELTRTLPAVKKFSDQNLTLADAHGLSILAARRIKTCWSTDRHLGLTGATLVM